MNVNTIVLIFKVTIGSLFLIAVRGTLCRYRIDQVVNSLWKDWIFVFLLYVVYIMFLYVWAHV